MLYGSIKNMKNKVKGKIKKLMEEHHKIIHLDYGYNREVGGVYISETIPISREDFEMFMWVFKFLYGHPNNFERKEGIEKIYTWNLEGKEFELRYSPLVTTFSAEIFVPSYEIKETDRYLEKVVEEIMGEFNKKITALKRELSKEESQS